MANPIARGFRNLTRFSGRDSRSQFWPYAGLVLGLGWVAGTLAMAWVLASSFGDMAAFADAHPDAATVTSAPGQYTVVVDAGHPEAPMPDFGMIITVVGIDAAAMVVLLSAAVARRLHDSGRSAVWGLMPLPFLATGLLLFPVVINELMSTDMPDMVLFFGLFANNVIYILTLAGLAVLLLMNGVRGPNRYGPPADIR